MTSYVTQAVLNNKFPCDGPQVVNLNLDFSTAIQNIADLTNLVQRGLISDVQALYIDNSQNGNPISVLVNITNQTLTVPAGAQAYLPALTQQPTYTFTTGAVGDVVRAFALNIPVLPCVWDTAQGGGGSATGNVNITEIAGVAVPNTGFIPDNLMQVGGAAITLGQKISSNSLPVAFASDQTAAIQNLQTVGGTAITLGQKAATASLPVTIDSTNQSHVGLFTPINNSTLTVSATTTSANSVITASQVLDIYNASTSTGLAFIAFGTTAQTATATTSLPVAPGERIRIFANGATNVAVIAATTATVYVTRAA